ncbi:MAG TPA: hypothetical protein VF516_01755 [Kofleriaceae bacterium]
MRDFRLELALDDGRLLGVTHEGRLRMIDRDGHDAGGMRDRDRIVPCGSVHSISVFRDRVLIKDKRELFVTDRALNLVERLASPPGGYAVFVGDGLVHHKDDRIVFIDRAGRPRELCRVPVELAYDAMDRWEMETGTPALAGWITVNAAPGGDVTRSLVEAAKDPSRGTALRRGGRLPGFAWRLGYLEPMTALFLVNSAVPPHLVICLSREGEPRWCTYLSSGCCGGMPTALPDGRLAVSSGCGGIVSWLDRRGTVLARRKPFEGVGLASACGSVVRPLADSGCVVDGGQGVTAYDASCELRWRSPTQCCQYDYDEQHGLLVTATWHDDEPRTWIQIGCVKHLGSLHPASA